MINKENSDRFTGKPEKEGKKNKPLQGHAREIRAIGRRCDEPIGSARDMPQGGLCIPPARPVVMIMMRAGRGPAGGGRPNGGEIIFPRRCPGVL